MNLNHPLHYCFKRCFSLAKKVGQEPEEKVVDIHLFEDNGSDEIQHIILCEQVKLSQIQVYYFIEKVDCFLEHTNELLHVTDCKIDYLNLVAFYF